MSKMTDPIVVIYCTCKDAKFDECPDGSLIRAIGNITPEFPNESLHIKHCKLVHKKQGECTHQMALGWIPRIPVYYYKGTVDGK